MKKITNFFFLLKSCLGLMFTILTISIVSLISIVLSIFYFPFSRVNHTLFKEYTKMLWKERVFGATKEDHEEFKKQFGFYFPQGH